MRYADDFVMGFECEEDAQRVYAVVFGKVLLNQPLTNTISENYDSEYHNRLTLWDL